MADASMTYFPVGNGDTTLIRLADGTSLLFDVNMLSDKEESPYDVHHHLLKEIRADNGVPHLDVFLLTHPDQDHIRGWSTYFYGGDPSKYSEKHKKEGRIIADEIWFAPRIFSPHEKEELSQEALDFRKEIDRRIDLYKKNPGVTPAVGNRIRIIGFSDNPELKGLEKLITVPGQSTNVFNGSAKNDFSVFVHAPTKKDTDSKWSERNDTSIVLQLRFRVGTDDRAALAFFGGDARCAIWQDIIAKSKEDDLQFDLFLAPHHCSWTFFSEEESENENANEEVVEFLRENKRKGAIVISSSKPIKDDDDNPPHFIAAQLYREEFGEKNLICTMSHPNEKLPEPIYFTMTKNGPVKDEYPKKGQVLSSAAIAANVATPRAYGR